MEWTALLPIVARLVEMVGQLNNSSATSAPLDYRLRRQIDQELSTLRQRIALLEDQHHEKADQRQTQIETPPP